MDNPSTSFRPSACETPLIRVLFITPEDGVQQATWHSSWRNDLGVVSALKGEGTAEAHAWAKVLTATLIQQLEAVNCKLIGIELVGSHTLELESGFGELA